jgi:hypothetical protein
MDGTDGNAFLKDVVSRDFGFALQAVKYLDVNRDEVVDKLLIEYPRRVRAVGRGFERLEEDLSWKLRDLPVAAVHEPSLRRIMRMGDMDGGAAASKLFDVKGELVKNEMLELMCVRANDYNFCKNGVARTLRRYVAEEDVLKILMLADALEDAYSPLAEDEDEDRKIHGFISGAAEVLRGLDLQYVTAFFLSDDYGVPVPPIRAAILCHLLWDSHSTAALQLAADLLIRGVARAATALYFVAEFSEGPLDWNHFTVAHVDVLFRQIANPKDKSWTLSALKAICGHRSDLASHVVFRAEGEPAILREALIFCADPTQDSLLFDAIRRFSMSHDRRLSPSQRRVFDEIDLNWAGKESLLVELLRWADAKVAYSIIEGAKEAKTLGTLEFGDIQWWLARLDKMLRKPSTHAHFYADRLGRLMVEHGTRAVRDAILAEFNCADSTYRGLLSQFFLNRFTDLTTADFSGSAISDLLSILKNQAHPIVNPLVTAATEEFVESRLMPLLEENNVLLVGNVTTLLRAIGRRHGRRYVSV